MFFTHIINWFKKPNKRVDTISAKSEIIFVDHENNSITSVKATKLDNEETLDKFFAKSGDIDLQNAYAAWKKDSDRMVQSAREMVKKSGKDTSAIDAVIKKYQNFK
jgi:hypothetical protein